MLHQTKKYLFNKKEEASCISCIVMLMVYLFFTKKQKPADNQKRM